MLNNYHIKDYPNIFIAGQLSGVEGYIESIASGLNVGLNMWQYLNKLQDIVFDKFSMIGALNNYLSTASPENFQPMSSNMGLINYGEIKMKDKKRLLKSRFFDKM